MGQEAVSIGLLGPVLVDIDGRPVRLSGLRRRLVAALALQPGVVVSSKRLTDALWGEDPPGSRARLPSIVSDVRAQLGAALVTRSPGYLLELPNGSVDATVFTRLVASARIAVRERRLEQAAEVYRRALALWRGAALADCADPGLLAEAARLDEWHLTAREESFEVELEIGRHLEIVADLTLAASQHPTRERLHAMLMLALYRSDRQIDALAVYERLRHALAEEFGVEPVEATRQLHTALLRNDPGLIHPKPAIEERPPSELPAEVAAFTGRVAKIDELSRHLTGSPAGVTPVVAISGVGGVGKSALALRVAHRVRSEFPDGQLYLNLRGATPGAIPVVPVEALARFLRSLGAYDVHIAGDAEEMAVRFRSRVAGKRLLIVLDDARDAGQVRLLLPGTDTCGVLVTCRRQLSTLDNVTHHPLDVLSEDEAGQLLSRVLGPRRVSKQVQAAADVARWCGHLPLALSIAAARLAARAEWPLSVLANRLADERRRLAELALDDRAVRASFLVSYQDLMSGVDGVAAARLFRMLGLLDVADVGIPVAATLLDTDEPHAERLLELLVDAQLLATHTPGRYQIHDLLRLLANELAVAEDDVAQRIAALSRVLHYYLSLGRRAIRLLEHERFHWRVNLGPDSLPHKGVAALDGDTVRAVLDSEVRNVVRVVRQSWYPDGGPALVVGIAVAWQPYLHGVGRWREIESLSILAIQAAEITGTLEHGAVAHRDLGEMCKNLGDLPKAQHHLGIALEAYRALGETSRLPACLIMLGSVYRRMGQPDLALRHVVECEELARRVGNVAMESLALIQRGFIAERTGNPRQAIRCQTRAAFLARKAGSDDNYASAMGNLGHTYRRAGSARAAIRCYERALAVSMGFARADHLWGLGQAQADLGDTARGRDAWRESAYLLFELCLIDADMLRRIEESERPEAPAILDMP